MKIFKIILIIFAGLTIFFSWLFGALIFSETKKSAGSFSTEQTAASVFFPGNDFVVSAELTKTPEQLARGLMYRDSLPINTGMLFVFPKEEPRSFWMKNTKIPLDIIFISSAGKVVDVKNNFSPCVSDPCPAYASIAPARYVLEVNAGLAAKKGIKIGAETIIR